MQDFDMLNTGLGHQNLVLQGEFIHGTENAFACSLSKTYFLINIPDHAYDLETEPLMLEIENKVIQKFLPDVLYISFQHLWNKKGIQSIFIGKYKALFPVEPDD